MSATRATGFDGLPKLRERAGYAAYATGWALVRRLPERAAYRLFRTVADLVWGRQGTSVRRLEENLRRVVGPDVPAAELRRLSRDGMRSYLRYWCDVFRSPDWDRARVVESVTPVHEYRIREGMAAGRGFVAALPHMGNWDHAGAWGSLTDIPVTTVAERVRPERLFERFVGFREGLGMQILPLTGGQQDLLGALRDALRAGRMVCLLADRDLLASGVEVTFFGARTRMPPGPALLALMTGAPLHPVSTAYDERGIVLTIHEQILPPDSGTTRERVSAMTQQVAAAFEAAIAAAPQDWHMLQRLWSPA